MAIFQGATFSKAHHFGALQPLVFGGFSAMNIQELTFH